MSVEPPPQFSFPTPLEIVQTRAFAAPMVLVFDAMTRPEHLRATAAPFDEEVTVCEIDLRVGGDYHIVFVPSGGEECSFRGTYLEVDPPRRTSQTWHFDGWPGVEAVETMDLAETAPGTTTMTYSLRFADEAGRARMTKYDGLAANFDNVAAYLATLSA